MSRKIGDNDKRPAFRYPRMMSNFDWNNEKNEMLRHVRGACFEEVLIRIRKGDVLDIIRHPNRERYPGSLSDLG
uniref:Uncharacterized protein n=1 Tax=Candidatus Kentrum sp. DK TaxID=2126562 RepID=A0A450SNP9_9GAMM|nr:MAG: hypothetical protein BECKDK2373C_GA0170839_10483 [Candidatus Kentron sp. DK]VFJ55461.1 MAG: hypothetical protein BECKDK2373B_GA0170837_105222 [Candidatus Kentron sp. DK]